MSGPLRPTSFSLVGLTMLDVGPLRGTTSVDLTDNGGVPTNLYLIMGPNGAGKTTILDAIYQGMALLGGRSHPEYLLEALNRRGAGIQLDALVQLDDGVRSQARLLSIVAGGPGLLKSWTPDELGRLELDSSQIVLQFDRRSSVAPVEVLPDPDGEAIAFLDAIRERAGEQPSALFGTSMALPTVLYFPSGRGIQRAPANRRTIMRPDLLGYSPARRFGVDGDTWEDSIENLLVWFTWLDPDLERSCRDTVNQIAFRQNKRITPVDRQNLSVVVETGSGERHRLDQLSSGERQLVQLVVRIAAHMTRSTIVLIDETEQHLHTVMRRRLLNILKEWAQQHEGLSFIMTSHQAESMRLLAPKLVEEGLHKGGCLVKPPFEAPR
jgi:energy-coupling factor transporter ATP-binding protein EcfA2